MSPSRMIRMLLRLFAIPLLLCGVAVAALLFLGLFIPGWFHSAMLNPLGEQAAQLALPAYRALLLAAAVGFIYQGIDLWRWYSNKTDFCHNCTGIVVYREGRYGPYFHCLACGHNRPDR